MKILKLMLLCAIFASSFAPSLAVRTKVLIKQGLPPSMAGPDTPPRTPSRDEPPVDVYLEDDGLSLYIAISEPTAIVTYTIYNVNGQSAAISNSGCIIGGEMVIDLSFLLRGSYTFSLQINEFQYWGNFDIE